MIKEKIRSMQYSDNFSLSLGLFTLKMFNCVFITDNGSGSYENNWEKTTPLKICLWSCQKTVTSWIV